HDWAGTLSPDAATAKEVRKLAEDGNRAIFNDVFGKLRKLYNGSPLKGRAAKAWDQKTLSEEQQMVQTGYEGVSRRALKVIESSAKQSSLRLKLGSWVMKKLDVIKLKGP